MHVYFVRHGETVSNRDNIVQGLTDELSERGKLQAAQIAQRTTHLAFETFISSDAVRAKETSLFIEQVTGKTPMYSEIFREVRRPSSFIGTSRESEEYARFLENERAQYENSEWRMEDAENFFDVKARATEAIEMLEGHNGGDILVVTHGNFLRFLATYLLVKKDISPDIWRKMGHTMLIDNTGLTTFRYTEGLWQLLTWNDHTHFAE